MTFGNAPTRRAALTAGLALGAGLAAPAIARAEPIRWRLVTSWPRGRAGPGITADRVVARINAMAAGRLEVQLFAAGEIVPAFSVLDAVGNGTVEAGHTASLYWEGRMPAAAFFCTVPFGMGPTEHEAWLSLRGGQELWDALYEEHGAKPFLSGNTGASMGGWFRRRLESAGDVAGLRIRVQGLGARVFEAMGATPIGIPAGDLQPALARGTVDAAEFLAPATDYETGLHETAPYYYVPGFNKPNGASELLINLDAYARLPDDLKAIVEQAARAEHSLALADAHLRNAIALRAILATGTVSLEAFPADLVAAAREHARTLIDEIAGGSELAGRIVESYRAAQAETAPWSAIDAEMARALARA